MMLTNEQDGPVIIKLVMENSGYDGTEQDGKDINGVMYERHSYRACLVDAIEKGELPLASTFRKYRELSESEVIGNVIGVEFPENGKPILTAEITNPNFYEFDYQLLSGCGSLLGRYVDDYGSPLFITDKFVFIYLGCVLPETPASYTSEDPMEERNELTD